MLQFFPEIYEVYDIGYDIKNTKNWYAIDALGAILPILTDLILGISQNISKISLRGRCKKKKKLK